MMYKILTLIAVLIVANLASADTLDINGTRHENVIVRAGGNLFYVQVPATGATFTVPKESAKLLDVSEPAARSALHRQWQATRGPLKDEARPRTQPTLGRPHAVEEDTPPLVIHLDTSGPGVREKAVVHDGSGVPLLVLKGEQPERGAPELAAPADDSQDAGAQDRSPALSESEINLRMQRYQAQQRASEDARVRRQEARDAAAQRSFIAAKRQLELENLRQQNELLRRQQAQLSTPERVYHVHQYAPSAPVYYAPYYGYYGYSSPWLGWGGWGNWRGGNNNNSGNGPTRHITNGEVPPTHPSSPSTFSLPPMDFSLPPQDFSLPPMDFSPRKSK